MDVYQKVLVKIYEQTGDRDNVDVDMVALLKALGFYPSIDDILDKMSSDGWVASSSRPTTIRITHWGMKAAKKALVDSPDTANLLDRHANRLQNEVHELTILVEEFNGKSTAENFTRIEKKLAEINVVLSKIKENV